MASCRMDLGSMYFVFSGNARPRWPFHHLGLLNGGFQAIAEAGLWERENVWADTAMASRNEIRAYLRRQGHRRLLFGSDFPFGNPSAELQKLGSLGLDPQMAAAVLGGNFNRLRGIR